MSEPTFFNTLVGLSCGHVTRADTFVLAGEPWHCLKCRRDVTIEHAPEEWSVRCLTCRYARQYGAARMTASHALDKHLRRAQQRGQVHVASLWHGQTPVETRRGTVERSLFDTDDTPPF